MNSDVNTMEAVARRVGVGKAALYRRWDSKDAMLIDLVARAVREHAFIQADTGKPSTCWWAHWASGFWSCRAWCTTPTSAA